MLSSVKARQASGSSSDESVSPNDNPTLRIYSIIHVNFSRVRFWIWTRTIPIKEFHQFWQLWWSLQAQLFMEKLVNPTAAYPHGWRVQWLLSNWSADQLKSLRDLIPVTLIVHCAFKSWWELFEAKLLGSKVKVNGIRAYSNPDCCTGINGSWGNFV